MSSAVIVQVVEQLEVLPFNLQSQVLNFARSLNNSVTLGVPGKSLLQFAGTIPTDDLRLMSQIIEEGCEQVDLNEW